MPQCDLSAAERKRRKDIAQHTRNMILTQLQIEDQDETSLMTGYRDYYLQVSFSELHPLMVFCLAKALHDPSSSRQRQLTNDLNLRSILGSHAINDDAGCYSYRAAHWLDVEMDADRFFEILNRCVDEADRGYLKLTA